jgi:hypothetical protein
MAPRAMRPTISSIFPSLTRASVFMRIFKFTTSAAPESFYRCFISVASFFLGNAGGNENMLRVKLRSGRRFAPSSYVGAKAPTP